MKTSAAIKFLAVAASGLMFVSCGVVESPLIPGSEAAAAKNQIMLVRAEPPSFGYRRLVTQTRNHPDLGKFIEKLGIPDFLAETGTYHRQYLILYYLPDRRAFACRNKSDGEIGMEFAGPYPITDKEYKLLTGFRKKAERVNEKT